MLVLFSCYIFHQLIYCVPHGSLSLFFFLALYHISLDASPKFRMANIRAELGENLSAVGHCARICVLLYFLSYGGDPLCVNKEHEDETELCVLLTRR